MDKNRNINDGPIRIPRRLSWLCVLAIGVTAVLLAAGTCFGASGGREILVSGAISLKNAFEELGRMYERQTGVVVRFNLGASGLLQRQIESGAPVDVFASAGEKQMDALQSRALIVPETRRDFAGNTLILIVPRDLKMNIHSFAELVRPEVTRVAIGNPKTVPAGQYAIEALTSLKVLGPIQQRLVLAENVRQVLDYVVRGEVEAGIVYASDVASGTATIRVAAQAPQNSHSPILYPVAVVRESAHPGEAKRFIDLMLSREGQAVLRKYGFQAAGAK